MDKPLLTVDRQMGLVIVTPDGKVCGFEVLHSGAYRLAYIGCENHLQAVVI